MMNYVRFSGKQYLSSMLSPLLQEVLELGDTIEVRGVSLPVPLAENFVA